MGKVNYQHLKRQKETARKNRQQEKQDRRVSNKGDSNSDAPSDASSQEEVTTVPGNALP
jgi:hypothetical protein